MYISAPQLQASIQVLDTVNPFYGTVLLTLLQEEIPVGKTKAVNFSGIMRSFLDKYYKPDPSYSGYYTPFKSSKPENKWVRPDYDGSLRRVARETFRDAFLGQNQAWGWTTKYIEALSERLKGERVSAFDLAVWLYRERKWKDTVQPEDLIKEFEKDFLSLLPNIGILFNLETAAPVFEWKSKEPISSFDLSNIIGPSPTASHEEGASLELLEMKFVGPTDVFRYEPALRLNIITGDNSLGKTFLLDTIWWGLTGDWLEPERPLLPQEIDQTPKSRRKAQISIVSVGNKGSRDSFTSNFDWKSLSWEIPPQKITLSGLVVYARYDGSFAVWDPTYVLARSVPSYNLQTFSLKPTTLLNSREVWYGQQSEERKGWNSNGLIRDWLMWQIGESRYTEQWEALRHSLKHLSPASDNLLIPANPVRMPFDSQEVPTLKMPYGIVPITNASAGIRRIVSLAYMLVWSWYRHLDNSRSTHREPQRRLVLLVDEIEAHLHPRWQRTVVPALMNVVSFLMPSVKPQIHIATHSPLVLASLEPFFNEQMDDLHNLKLNLETGVVNLEELNFVKQGRVDMWLMSEIFGLDEARSLPAEQAIEAARQLQKSNISVTTEQVMQVHEWLKQVLPAHDTFWSRWTFFAEKHGVDE
jgi:hypothetical protein